MACLLFHHLARHADVNAANNRGDTPLHAAAYRGYANVLCRLMEAGANPFLKNSASMTALQEAFVQRNQECVQLLQQYMDVPGNLPLLCSPLYNMLTWEYRY